MNDQLVILEALPNHSPADVKPLRGKEYRELVEVRIKAGKIQYRPLGHREANGGIIILLVGAVEKGGKFQPATVLDTALERLRLIRSGRATTCEHDIS